MIKLFWRIKYFSALIFDRIDYIDETNNYDAWLIFNDLHVHLISASSPDYTMLHGARDIMRNVIRC